MLTLAQRHAAVDVAHYLIQRQPQITWMETRPMKINRKLLSAWTLAELKSYFAAGGEVDMDCSMAIAACYHFAGITDPTGFAGAGWGNTDSMWEFHSHRFTEPHEAGLAGIVLFGNYPGTQHGAMVIETGRNPLLFTHGGKGQPVAMRFEDLWDGFSGYPATFLDVSHD